MHGKKEKVQSNASSRFGGNTFASPHASGSSGHGGGGSKRTTDFLDIGGRDEVDAKVVWFLYVCGLPFNVLHSPYWHDMAQAINKTPKGYKCPKYEKDRTMLLDRERTKIQRDLTRFIDE
jgi:hypothetical protein